jgi:shikimate dehydrogenase
MSWVDKDTEIYCSFAKKAGNTGCQMMNSAFYYHRLNKIYKSFSVDNISLAVGAVKTLNIKGFAITMPYKKHVLDYVDSMEDCVKEIGAANTVINTNGKLHAYNTDYLAALEYLSYYNNKSYKDWNEFFILGDGGYAAAVKAAANKLNMPFTNITRNNWDKLNDVKSSLIYNCTPVENLSLDSSNIFIDCIVTTDTGHKLATMQASHQYKLYTKLEFPWKT